MRMSRPCSICNHEKRAEIDALLISSEMSFEMIAARFEGLTAASLHRHKTNHLFKAVRESKRAQDVVKADSILNRVEALIGRTEKILETCEASGDARTSIAALREIRGNLEFLARLQGEIADNVTFNVYVNPQWVQLRQVIISSLDDYPEARASLLKGLEHVDQLEGPHE